MIDKHVEQGRSVNALMVAGRSTAKLAESANKIRKLAKASGHIKNHYLDIAGFFEYLAGTLPDSFKFHVAEAREFPDQSYEGLTLPDGRILIRENVYEGAHDGNGRDRFTMTHELLHWALHRDEFAMARSSATVPTYKDPEWQANTGASLILISDQSVIECCGDTEQLAEVCGVSVPAAIAREKIYSKHKV